MESTKIIAVRISPDKYEKILIECNKREISITDWIQTQFAIANSAESALYEILEELEIMSEEIVRISQKENRKLRRLIEKIRSRHYL